MSSKLIKERQMDSLVLLLILGLMCLTCVLVYFPYTYDSLNMECLILGCVFLFLLYGDERFESLLPSFVVAVAGQVLLILSGRFFERGFNAPFFHAYKFLYVFYSGTMAVTMQKLDRQYRKIVIVAAVGTVLVSSILSIYFAGGSGSTAMRSGGSHTLIAGFNQTNAIPTYVLLMLIYFRSVKSNRFKRIVSFFSILILSYYVYCSGFTTALFLTIVGAIVAFILTDPGNKIKYGVIALIVLVVMYIFRQTISDAIYSNTANMLPEMRQRIRYAADKIFGTVHDTEGYAHESRDRLLAFSLTTFKSHVLLGVGYSGYGYGVIGAHFEWADMLGVFGLIGTVVILLSGAAFAVPLYKDIKTPIDRLSFILALLMLVTLGFLNPCLSLPSLIATFVVAPNLSVFLENQEPTITAPVCKYFRA